MLDKYMPDIFSLGPLSDRLGEGNAKRFYSEPNFGVIRRVKDMARQEVFVVSFTNCFGVEVWVLPVVDTAEDASEIRQEALASELFKAELERRTGKPLVHVWNGTDWPWADQTEEQGELDHCIT